MIPRLFFASVVAGVLLGPCRPALAQATAQSTSQPTAQPTSQLTAQPTSQLTAQPADAAAAVAEVRQTIDAAWKEMQAYDKAGGKPDTPDHPALKWHATLWAYREQHPGTEAAARATADAIRLLVRGQFWDQAHARTETVGADDPAWVRLSSAIYEEGITRKDFPYTIATLSKIAAASADPKIRSAVLLDVGRAQRRQGDMVAATKTLEGSRSAAPGAASAEEADRILYEISHLSVGLPAPTFSTKGRNGKTVDLAAFHGRPVVLVFWSTT